MHAFSHFLTEIQPFQAFSLPRLPLILPSHAFTHSLSIVGKPVIHLSRTLAYGAPCQAELETSGSKSDLKESVIPLGGTKPRAAELCDTWVQLSKCFCCFHRTCLSYSSGSTLSLWLTPEPVTQIQSLIYLCTTYKLRRIFFLVLLNGCQGAWEMVQDLGASLPALPWVWFSVTTWQLTTMHNSSSREPEALFWSPWVSGKHAVHKYISRQTLIHIKKSLNTITSIIALHDRKIIYEFKFYLARISKCLSQGSHTVTFSREQGHIIKADSSPSKSDSYYLAF
jgi:hypothetical protein